MPPGLQEGGKALPNGQQDLLVTLHRLPHPLPPKVEGVRVPEHVADVRAEPEPNSQGFGEQRRPSERLLCHLIGQAGCQTSTTPTAGLRLGCPNRRCRGSHGRCERTPRCRELAEPGEEVSPGGSDPSAPGGGLATRGFGKGREVPAGHRQATARPPGCTRYRPAVQRGARFSPGVGCRSWWSPMSVRRAVRTGKGGRREKGEQPRRDCSHRVPRISVVPSPYPGSEATAGPPIIPTAGSRSSGASNHITSEPQMRSSTRLVRVGLRVVVQHGPSHLYWAARQGPWPRGVCRGTRLLGACDPNEPRAR